METTLKKKAKIWLLGLGTACIPVLVAIVRLALDGKAIWDVYLPNSTWNDELLYYKLTEACVNYTIPQGFFGFNESHALVGSFAAWSPILLIFWVMWGVVFGWNLLSPILCNMVVMAFGMYFFGRFMRPKRWQFIMMTVLYLVFIPVTRFTLSGMPEAQMYALLLFIIALTWETEQNYEPTLPFYRVRLGMLLGAIILLTLMRPYYILLFGCFIHLVRKRNGKKATAVICSSWIGLTIIVYGLISHYLSAPYLTDLFYTDWLTAYKDGLLHGLKYDIWKLFGSLKSIFVMMLQKAPEGKLLAGSLYFLFLVCLVFWIIVVIQKEKWNIPYVIRAQMLVLMVGFWGADLMMYRLQEGGRHTIAFIFVTMMCLPFAMAPHAEVSKMESTESVDEKPYKARWSTIALAPAVVGIGIIALSFVLLGKLPYEFDIPYAMPERVAEIDSLHQQLEENMTLNMGATSYENTVIWPIWDKEDGETVVFDWGMLYALPAGFGINACDGGYVEAQMGNLKCGYIATMKGSDVEKWGEENATRVSDEDADVIVYRCE